MSPRFAWLTTTMILMPELARKKGTSTKAVVPESHESACKRMVISGIYLPRSAW
mgnify:CR=1 FL=1